MLYFLDILTIKENNDFLDFAELGIIRFWDYNNPFCDLVTDDCASLRQAAAVSE